MSIALTLQPYLRINANKDNPSDVDDGLYNFLSPRLLPERSASTTALPDMSGVNVLLSDITGGSTTGTNKSSRNSNSNSKGKSSINKSNKAPAMDDGSTKSAMRHSTSEYTLPMWYQEGHDVSKLLEEAEMLNWAETCEHDYQLLKRYILDKSPQNC